jgi:hypothetical protein
MFAQSAFFSDTYQKSSEEQQAESTNPVMRQR